jgi:phospholipid/cholesterol/gamma-HCH transport system ATP-binding protein
VIRLEDVHKAFGQKHVLRGMSFEVKESETFVLMGRSGTGKSTVLRLVIGLLEADRGRVLVDGANVPDLDRKGMMQLRRNMGYLFQSGALINWLSVYENVALPLREYGVLRDAEIDKRVIEKLALVDMVEARDLLPEQISGGMRKRAAIARALVNDPRILLYDEPTAGLDPLMSRNVNSVIRSIQDRLKVTSVVVTHNLSCAYTVGDRIALMDAGRIVEQGTPDQMRSSQIPEVREFLSGEGD